LKFRGEAELPIRFGVEAKVHASKKSKARAKAGVA